MSHYIFLTHEYPPFRGGIGTVCEQTARASAALGHTVTVVAPDFGKPEREKSDISSGVRLSLFRGSIFHKMSFPRVLLLTFREIVAQKRSSFFVAIDWPFVLACGLLRRIMKFDYAAFLHGSEILFFKKSIFLQAITLGNPFWGASSICVNSQYTANLLYANYPFLDRKKVRVAYLGVDDFWFEKEVRSDVLKRASIPLNKKIVLTVGRIHPRKGQSRCMAALEELPEALQKNVVYVIVGQPVDAAYDAEIRAMASRMTVPVIFMNDATNEDVRTLYKTSSVFCLPAQVQGTKVEGFGLVFLEAAASGLPSISTNCAAIPEVIRDKETGLLVPENDRTALTGALQQMLSEEPFRQKLGEKAQRWAKDFTWRRCAELMLENAGA